MVVGGLLLATGYLGAPPAQERSVAMTRTLLTAACLFVVASSALGAPPKLDDYAQGIDIVAPSGLPLVEMPLPDAVYQTVTRADLGDMRVFNAEGQPVPHAFCTALTAGGADGHRALAAGVRAARRAASRAGGSRIEVQTPSGTQVNVREPGSGKPVAINGHIHIIDARDSEEPIRAIQFDWQSPDGASQAQVSIEASDDLDKWRVLVPASTLLCRHQRRAGAQARAHRAAGASLRLSASAAHGRRSAADDRRRDWPNASARRVEIDPAWFMATNHVTDDIEVLFYDTGRRAPVTYARSALAAGEQLRSRNAAQSRRCQGAVVRALGRRSVSDRHGHDSGAKVRPAQFAATSDRYWRLQIAKDPQLYRDDGAGARLSPRTPAISGAGLGAVHARVRQPARGGSLRRAAATALLADFGSEERSKLVGEGVFQTARVLGGDMRCGLLPKKTPVRLVVLWTVLIVGVGMLVAMALVLLKRVRRL